MRTRIMNQLQAAPRSERRSSLKNGLKGPTLLEMSGNPHDLSGTGRESGIVILMRWQSALKTAAASVFGCVLVACNGGSEEVGRIRVTPSEVAGIYQSGAERLELQANGTDAQDLVSDSQRLHHTGQWRILNHFLDGSEVPLV